MSVDAATLKSLINQELEHLSDTGVLAHIRSLLVEPKSIMRDWDYGPTGQQYPCWAVLNDDPSNSSTGIAYCEHGFGPERPWGLVWLDGDDMSMGMDSGWYTKFLDAYFESFAPMVLPIWRVVRVDSPGNYTPLTNESSHDETSKQIKEFERADPKSTFWVYHTIEHGPGD